MPQAVLMFASIAGFNFNFMVEMEGGGGGSLLVASKSI